jgi:hypothetical protein
LKTYTYKAKDGTLITGIPEDVKPDDPRLYERYKQMKASGQTSGAFIGKPSGPPMPAQGAPTPKPQTAESFTNLLQNPLNLPADKPAATIDPLSQPSNQLSYGVKPHPKTHEGQAQSGNFIPTAEEAKNQLPHDIGAASRGIAQGLLTVPAYLTDALNSLANLALPEELKANQFNEVLNTLMTHVGVPEAETKAQKLLQAGASGLFSGGGSVLAGKALQYAPSAIKVAEASTTAPAIMQQISKIPAQTSLNALSQSMQAAPAAQAISGAAAEGTIELARQKGASPLVQAGLGMAAGGLVGIPSSLKRAPIGPGPVQDAAEVGGKLLTSDVFQPKTPFFKAAQAIAEKIPLTGTGGVRKAQQAGRINMIEELVQRYDASDLPQISSAVTRNLIDGRADKLAGFSAAKNEVIDKLSFQKLETLPGTPESFDLPLNPDGTVTLYHGTTQKGKQSILQSGLLKADAEPDVYLTTDPLGGGYGDGSVVAVKVKPSLLNLDDEFPGGRVDFRINAKKPGGTFRPSGVGDQADLSRIVPMPLATKKIDDSIAMLESLKDPSTWGPYINKLKDMKGSIDTQDLRNIEINRSTIGDHFAASEIDSVKRMGKKLVTGTESEPGIYAAVNEDMGNFIKKNGSQVDYDKWKASNKSISLLLKELDDGILETVLEEGKVNPEIMQRMLFSKYKSDLDQLYRNLGEEGRASAVSAIISKATNLKGDNFSPDKFVAEITKLKPQVGIFLQGKGKDQLEGFIRYLKMTERAGQYGLNPPTGVQAVVPMGALGLGALGQQQAKGLPGLVGSIAASATLGIIPRIIESKATRNMLINLGKVKEGSKEAQELFAALMASIQSSGKADRNQYQTQQEEEARANER